MMAVRKILQATERRGEAILRRKSNKVRDFGAGLESLVSDMFETMNTYRGVGLAAPQVGVLQRVIVAELPAPVQQDEEGQETGERPPLRLALCNPKVAWSSDDQDVGEEGCLSLEGWYAKVPRAQAVEVRYQDLQGRRRKVRAEGYLARILQHEIDHLEGVLFTDRVQDLGSLVCQTETGPEPVPREAVPSAGRPD
jgi:peptide deformylase